MLINTLTCESVDMENGNGYDMIYLSPSLSPCIHGKRKRGSDVAAIKHIF
jgi:hypothetical protein